MFCANCYKEIPADKSYYKHQDTNQSYCSLDCLNDHMIYTHTITLETSEGEESTEEQDNDEWESHRGLAEKRRKAHKKRRLSCGDSVRLPETSHRALQSAQVQLDQL